MFGIKAPEVLLLGLLLAVALTAVHFRARLQSIISPGRVPCLSLLILGSFFPLAYLTLTGPALHNGARHFLFAFPALAVCAAWAYLETADWIGLHRPRLVPLARLVFAFLILLPVSYLIRLHPYQYVYFNALSGGPSGAYGSYETEYWFTSSKHAVETLDTLRRSGALVMPEGRAARVFILGPWQVAEPFLPESYELTGDPNEADFHILNTQMMVHQSFHGDTLFVIERLGVPICVVNAATTQ